MKPLTDGERDMLKMAMDNPIGIVSAKMYRGAGPAFERMMDGLVMLGYFTAHYGGGYAITAEGRAAYEHDRGP